ncbi:MAG: carbon-nitrogen hydrolase family protein [Thermoanaerobaculia bacterium]
MTVCELSNDPALLNEQWEKLASHVETEQSELVLLPEMPFYRWLAADREMDSKEWQESVVAHERWVERLVELGDQSVAATRPIIDDGIHFNQGFVWDPKNGARAVHNKHYLPDEEGFWEASWYSAGGCDFSTVQVRGTGVGFMICTEMWFLQHAREYGRKGVQILACPRATLAESVDKWVAGGRVTAVVSGAFCLSSNLSGQAGRHGDWAGTGWIIEPEEGQVLGTTSSEAPFLTIDIDLEAAETAKRTYPRYVPDL